MTQAIQKHEELPPVPIVHDDSAFANLLDSGKFEHMYRVAQVFSQSTIIPEHYRKNDGNCFIALQMAVRLKVDPFMFMQRTYVVHGKPGMEAQLAIALINTSGLFVDSLDYEIHCDDPEGTPFDPSYRVRAFAVRKSTGKTIAGPWIDWPLVQGEGWDKKEGSKWKTMPAQMFLYRAATFFGRVHCPERLAGMETVDEVDDRIVDVSINAEPARRISLRGMKEIAEKTQHTGADPSPKPSTPVTTAAGPVAPPNLAAETTGPAPEPIPTPAGGGNPTPSPAPRGRPKVKQIGHDAFGRETVQQAAAESPSDGAANVAANNASARPVPTHEQEPESYPPHAVTKAQQAAHDGAKAWSENTDLKTLRGKLSNASIGTTHQKSCWGNAKAECQYSDLLSEADDAMVRRLAYWYGFFDQTGK